MSLAIHGIQFGYGSNLLFEKLEVESLRRGELTALVGPLASRFSDRFVLLQNGAVAVDGALEVVLGTRRQVLHTACS